MKIVKYVVNLLIKVTVKKSFVQTINAYYYVVECVL